MKVYIDTQKTPFPATLDRTKGHIGHENLPEKFLWINKDDAQTRNPNDLRRAINRHAQLGRPMARRSHRQQSLQESSVISRPIAVRGFAFKPYVPSQKPSINLKSGHEQQRQGDCDTTSPFRSAELIAADNVSCMMQYHLAHCITTSLKNQFSATGRTTERDLYFQHLKRIIPDCLSSEMHMYALLSATAGRMTMVSKVHENYANHFMQNAIRLMGEYLSKTSPTVNSLVIRDIQHLWISEWYRGNHSAALIHLRILGNLAQVLDLRKLSDKFLFANTWCFDVFLDIETGAPPIFPLFRQSEKPQTLSKWKARLHQTPQRRVWDPFRASTTHNKFIGITTGPFSFLHQSSFAEPATCPIEDNYLTDRGRTGFIEAINAGIFGVQIRIIFVDLVIYLETAADGFTYSEPDTLEASLMGKKTIALLHRLLSTTTEEDMDDPCRLSVIIMLSYVSNPMAWRSNPFLALQLLQAVLKLDLRHLAIQTRNISRILLWVLIVGMFAAGDGPVFNWFLFRAQSSVSKLALRDYIELEQLMARHIYFRKAQHNCLVRLVATLSNGVI